MGALAIADAEKGLSHYIEELLKTHGLLGIFRTSKHFITAIKATNAACLYIKKNGSLLVVGQYVETIEDISPDLELIFRIDKSGKWRPLDLYLATAGWRSCVDGSWISNRGERLVIQEFSRGWIKKLVDSDFENGEVIELSGENA